MNEKDFELKVNELEKYVMGLKQNLEGNSNDTNDSMEIFIIIVKIIKKIFDYKKKLKKAHVSKLKLLLKL